MKISVSDSLRACLGNLAPDKSRLGIGRGPPSGVEALWISVPDALEKEMATHSSILAWKIPWTAEPGRLLSMGLQRVRHD